MGPGKTKRAYKNLNVEIYPILLPRHIIRRSRQWHTRAIQFDGFKHHSTIPDTWKQYYNCQSSRTASSFRPKWLACNRIQHWTRTQESKLRRALARSWCHYTNNSRQQIQWATWPHHKRHSLLELMFDSKKNKLNSNFWNPYDNTRSISNTNSPMTKQKWWKNKFNSNEKHCEERVCCNTYRLTTL